MPQGRNKQAGQMPHGNDIKDIDLFVSGLTISQMESLFMTNY